MRRHLSTFWKEFKPQARRKPTFRNSADEVDLEKAAPFAFEAQMGERIGTDSHVDGYSREGFTVNNCFYKGPIVVMPGLTLNWSIGDEIELNDFELFKHVDLEILLVGGIRRPDKEFSKRLKEELGGLVGIEFVSTSAALASYNVLTKEDRLVAAAMVPAE